MKIMILAIIILILVIKVLFQIRIDLIDWHFYIYYWNLKQNKRMCVVI